MSASSDSVRARRALHASPDLRQSLGRSFRLFSRPRRDFAPDPRLMALDRRGRQGINITMAMIVSVLLRSVFVLWIVEMIKKYKSRIVFIIACFLCCNLIFTFREWRREEASFRDWLDKNNLSELRTDLRRQGFRSLEECADMDVPAFISKTKRWTSWFTGKSQQAQQLQKAVDDLKSHFKLKKWLETFNINNLYGHFESLGYSTLEDVKKSMTDDDAAKIFGSLGYIDKLYVFRKVLAGLRSGKRLNAVEPTSSFFSLIWYLLNQCAAVLLTMYTFNVLRKSYRRFYSSHENTTFSTFVTGHYLEPTCCYVEWGWTNPAPVGDTMHFKIKFYRYNRTVYPVTSADEVLVEILDESGTFHEHTLAFPSDASDGELLRNEAKVTFTVRHAGTYTVNVMVSGDHIWDSPAKRTFIPCAVEPSKSVILQSVSTAVVTRGIYHTFSVECRDKFDNICPLVMERTDFYSVDVQEIGHGNGFVDPEMFILPDCYEKRNTIHVKVDREGCFRCEISYNGKVLQNGIITLISLTEEDQKLVQERVEGRSWTIWYEGYLLTPSSPVPTRQTEPAMDPQSAVQFKKSGKVYFYVSPKQITVKEFYLKFIPYRLHTVRVCPSTKIQVNVPANTGMKYPTFTLEDGTQPPIHAMSKDRNLLLATFSEFLCKNIGGSETFSEKMSFFYSELTLYHKKRLSSSKVHLKINRSKVLESSIAATKNFSTSDWLKTFEVTFIGEEGLDYGGLQREWFELVCKSVFSHENHLFTWFEADNPQALIHPNPRRPAHLKLKHFEFAGRIVGKCLLESAISPARRKNVKARFTRSFLAQLIGLRVNYRYFERDDKQLYTSKIKYIEENDPEPLELVFAEEEFAEDNQLEKVVELKSGGSNIPVTESNKIEYLNLLAHYRMTKRVGQEIDAFLKGLNDLIPDNLLSIFDENELELLMCGTGGISVGDFKQNHDIIGTTSLAPAFKRTLSWFWTVVGSFTQEELGRLLQFITGSSQLPPGGFAELVPKIQISCMPGVNDCLPMAHTCFNQLCLPVYSTCEDLQRCLHLAITEGNEGFGLA